MAMSFEPFGTHRPLCTAAPATLIKAIRVHRHGGPEVLNFEDVRIGEPGPGEVLVRNRAIGVNFVDTYLRSGAFAPSSLPFTPGKEGAGDVVAIGAGVTDFAPGDRVAFVETLGAYAEQCIVPTHFLGKATFPGSLDCLRPFGYFVSFGFASGAIPSFDPLLLLEKGSLFATWPGLTMHLAERADVLSMSQALFDVIARGAVKIPVPTRLPLVKAAEAHRRLEARQTTGATVLLP